MGKRQKPKTHAMSLPDLAPLDRQLAHTPSKKVPVHDQPPEYNADFARCLYSQEPAPQEDVVRDEGHTNYTNDDWSNQIFSNGYTTSTILYNEPLNDTVPKLPTKPAVSKTLRLYDRIICFLILILIVVFSARYVL